MKSRKTNGKTASVAAIAFVLVLFTVRPQAALAQQWTTNGNNISNTNSGNVGIGTTTPYTKLWIESDGVEVVAYRKTNYGHAAYVSYPVALSPATPLWEFGLFGGSPDFRIWSWDGTLKIPFTIQPSGNVGLGTTSPGSKLTLDAGGGSSNTFTIQNMGSGGTFNIMDSIIDTSRPSGLYLMFVNNTKDINLQNGKVFFKGNGNVGIGTTTPGYKLDVAGSINTTGVNVNGSPITSSQWATNGANINYASGNVGIGTSTPTTKLHVAGDGSITGNLTVDGNIAAKYQDVAEWVPASQHITAGTVVVLDPNKSNQVVQSAQAYDTRVAGVISEQPGIALGERGDNKVLVATTGRVRIKVDATRGPIRIGDLLVTSDISGRAMKSEPVNIGGVQIHRPGTLIGKALEPLEKGTGEILVLLSLQ